MIVCDNNYFILMQRLAAADNTEYDKIAMLKLQTVIYTARSIIIYKNTKYKYGISYEESSLNYNCC